MKRKISWLKEEPRNEKYWTKILKDLEKTNLNSPSLPPKFIYDEYLKNKIDS